MRRLILLTITLLVIAGCQVPRILPTFTPASKPAGRSASAITGRPTQSPTAGVDFSAVFQQLADQLGEGPFLDPNMASETQRALAAFLNAKANSQQPLERQPMVIDELRSALDVSPVGKSDITIADVDGDGRTDVLVTVSAEGLPGFIVRHLPDGFVGYQVPKSEVVSAYTRTTFERVDDLNGDDVPEIVLTIQSAGATAVNTLINVLRWDGQGFKTLLQIGVSDWAGPAGWEFAQENGSEALVTKCPALGVYYHKLLPHLQLTRTFHWQDNDLISNETRLEPPETIRQQINVAESAFRKGQLDRALTAYTRALEDKSLTQESATAQIDWRAYAQLRIGQIEALHGNTEAAREAMSKVKAAGPALSDLATAFLEGYNNGGAARGLAAMQRVNLYERFYFKEGGNLGFPMDAAGVLYPGLAVAAYLNTHPDASHSSGEALTDMLRDLGLDVAGSAVVDLDNDGRPEVIVVLNRTLLQEIAPEGRQQSLWLLTWQEAGWWPQQIETASSLTLTQTAPVPEGGQRAVVYQRPENVSPREAAISWDGSRLVRYNLLTANELIAAPRSNDPFACTIP